jgi:uncharacterized RmlC-like cupin family protein
MRYGEGLRKQLELRAGRSSSFLPGMPHLQFNPSDDEVCVAVLARTDPDEQKSVVLLDENGKAPTPTG